MSLKEQFAEFAQPVIKNVEKEVLGPTLDDIPFALSPLQYAGLGDFRPPEPKITPNVLKMPPLPRTMDVKPIFDLLTGELTGYEDLPLATAPSDSKDFGKSLGTMENYQTGLVSNINLGIKHNEEDYSKYIAALETGTNLLVTPFSQETANEDLVDLPDLPDLPSMPAAPSKKEDAPEEAYTDMKAEIDDWNTSQFDAEHPNPALRFPFKLDDFQLRAIHRLEREEIAFVSAPTSAGKTVVAQYAIALARQHKMRCLYTSPIKALSNQKFRDLRRQFGDVGILTGDVSLNREASCIIMTTEILRSMLYKGADLLRDVDIVIFDECHYLSDDERGVVWEESIILMPPHINMVFLSATIPNDVEVASWISRTKRRPVFVQRHLERPVPLVHCIYANNNVYQLQKPNQAFDHNSSSKARKKFLEFQKKAKAKKPLHTPGFWVNVVKTFKKQNLLPALMFVFSRKNLEKFAKFVAVPEVKLIDDAQKSHILNFFNKSIQRLRPEDRKLPQVHNVRELLQFGVGIHHSGMLPILKEIVEILLADGYVQVLFCTSTFAMGINVPARSCAFTSTNKFNGKEVVPLTPTEYVQMSGRAGRRGLDTAGNAVLILSDEFPDDQFLKTTFEGRVEQLNSQFYVRFNMILNLIRIQGIGMVELLKRTLSANKVQSSIPKKKQELENLEQTMKDQKSIECTVAKEVPPTTADFMDIEDIGDIAMSYAMVIDRLKGVMKDIRNIAGQDEIMKLIDKNQVVLTSSASTDLAVVLSKDKKNIKIMTRSSQETSVAIDSILAIFPNKLKSATSDALKMEFDKIDKPLDLKRACSIKTPEFHSYVEEYESAVECVLESPCFECSSRSDHFSKAEKMLKDNLRRQKLHEEISKESESFMEMLDPMLDMLKDMGYISKDDIIQMKGRISIEVQSCHEIIGTELLTQHFFDDLDPASIAAICACLVTQRVGKDAEPKVPPHLIEKYNELRDIVSMIEEKMEEFSVDHMEEFVEYNTNSAAMEAVHMWASGESFNDIIRVAGEDVPEGAMIRIMLMTVEVLRSLSNASRLTGNIPLAEKFEAGIELIQRDIIFSSSLYFD